MANISTYIAQIESASRGEEVRDSIINALNAINKTAESASGSGGSIDNAALANVFETGLIGTKSIYDSTPKQGSKKAVESGGLYTLLGNIEALLDRINGEVK